ncbi:hypothetical protein PINS_up000034 [Pythium insidiosum]|nr:hypothetical protein PINS_up000034 [Pythium insidiosum]
MSHLPGGSLLAKSDDWGNGQRTDPLSIFAMTLGSSDECNQSLKKRRRDMALGEHSEPAALERAHGAAEPEPEDSAALPRIRQLLEPFSREQLLEILASAAAQHDDVLREIKAAASTDVAHRKVFVRGLAWETTSERLREAFSVFGDVDEAAVIYDKASGKSRGYGFVTFIDMHGAEQAVEKQTLEIDGRVTTCNLAAVRTQQSDEHASHSQQQTPSRNSQPQLQPSVMMPPYAMYPPYMASVSTPPGQGFRGGNDESERKLFVRGLAWDTSDETLRAVFQVFGELVEASVVRERKTGKSKGFGFVTYRHRASAELALQQPAKMIDGRQVNCNLASLGRSNGSSVLPGGHSPSVMYPGLSHGGYPVPMQADPTVNYSMGHPSPVGVDPYHAAHLQQAAYGYSNAYPGATGAPGYFPPGPLSTSPAVHPADSR